MTRIWMTPTTATRRWPRRRIVILGWRKVPLWLALGGLLGLIVGEHRYSGVCWACARRPYRVEPCGAP